MNKTSIIVVALALAVLILTRIGAPKQLEWTPSYQKTSTEPLGTKVFYHWLEREGRLDGELEDVPFRKSLDEIDPNAALLILTDRLEPDNASRDSLFRFVRGGGHLIIASSALGSDLEDSLEIRTTSTYMMTEISDAKTGVDVAYDWSIPNLRRVFASSADTVVAEGEEAGEDPWIALLNGKEYFVAAKRRYGHGMITLTTIPELTSNYALLYENMATATEVILNSVPEERLIWDAHYKPAHASGQPLLYTITQYPGLEYGYWMILITCVLYIVLGGRRKQRVISVREGHRSTSLEYIENIAGLYNLGDSNRLVAERFADQFAAFVRRRTGIRLAIDAMPDKAVLTAMLGIDLDLLDRMLNRMELLKGAWTPSDEEFNAFHKDLKHIFSQGHA